jgi:hypothetical protein
VLYLDHAWQDITRDGRRPDRAVLYFLWRRRALAL